MSNSKRETLPSAVVAVLKKLGSDIRSARLRRRMRAATLASHAAISRTTLHKIERGTAGVSIGKYTLVLHALGLHTGVERVADRSVDSVGLDALEERLPKRVRVPRSQK